MEKKDKIVAVKEHILIRYLGLGWVEAHHPWSYKGHTYTAIELFEHFVKLGLPLAKKWKCRLSRLSKYP